MTQTKDPDRVRAEVAAAYARAVSSKNPAADADSATGDSGCCTSACCTPPQQKGVAVQSAGYSREELDALPGDAAVNSFGCGNPVALAGLREGDVVVDLGSGAGIDLFLAAKRIGPTGRVIGIDMTREMIDRARANIAASGFTNIEVREGLIEDLPVDDDSVDWVISNCVINLSPQKDRVFAEVHRVLKSGGRVSVTDIVVDSLPDSLRRHAGVYASCIGGAISEADYLETMRSAGLTDATAETLHVYDAKQLLALVGSETEIEDVDPASIAADLEAVVGDVRSVRFTARKR